VGSLTCSDGTTIPLKAEIAESTETDLGTDLAYTVVSQNVGDYKPGGVITAGSVTCDNGVAYCYILSQGLVAALIPFGVKGAVQDVPALCKPYKLQAGDKVRVLSLAAATRTASLSVYTASGKSRIFTVLPTGGATNSFLDLQTQNTIGDTLQNERIVRWAGASVDGSKIETNGFYVIDQLGNVVGACPATDPGVNQPQMSAAYNVGIQLNYNAQFLTNA